MSGKHSYRQREFDGCFRFCKTKFRVRLAALTYVAFLAGPALGADLECERKTWFDNLPSIVEGALKIKLQKLDSKTQAEIIGKWQRRELASSESSDNYVYEFNSDGTATSSLADKFRYQLKDDMILLRDNEKTCWAVFYANGKFYIPSRENLLVELKKLPR